MTAPEGPVLCVLVDAFREDYLNEQNTPFMAGLARDGFCTGFNPLLGYSDAIRVTLFTGAYPDESGYWMEYCFRPEESPFGWMSKLEPLDRFPSDFMQRAFKYSLSLSVARRMAANRGYFSVNPRHIPFGALRFFDYTLKKPMTAAGAVGTPTIFDRMSRAGLEWTYLDSSKTRRSPLLQKLRELPLNTSLVYVYLHHIDMASHLFGLDSRRLKGAVTKADGYVKEIYETVAARLGEPRTLVFSDHGMSPARQIVSLPELRWHPAFGTGFCFALDATMVRLWYLNDDEGLREELKKLIAARLPGEWLEETERKRLHLDFEGRLYGDDIFLCDPGIVIFPNFHSYLKPKAMHAYHPEDKEQRAIFIASKGTGFKGPEVDIADLAGLTLDLTGAFEPERS